MKKGYIPLLQSKNIILRPPQKSDIDERLLLGANSEYHQFFGDDETLMRPREALQKMWFEDIDTSTNSEHQFAQIEIHNKWVGSVSLAKIDFKHSRVDLVLGIYDKKYWGQGYGTEIIAMVLNYAFDILHIHRVSGNIIASNKRSLKAIEKVGFKKEGILKDYFFINGIWYDSIVVAILENEFRSFQKNGKSP